MDSVMHMDIRLNKVKETGLERVRHGHQAKLEATEPAFPPQRQAAGTQDHKKRHPEEHSRTPAKPCTESLQHVVGKLCSQTRNTSPLATRKDQGSPTGPWVSRPPVFALVAHTLPVSPCSCPHTASESLLVPTHCQWVPDPCAHTLPVGPCFLHQRSPESQASTPRHAFCKVTPTHVDLELAPARAFRGQLRTSSLKKKAPCNSTWCQEVTRTEETASDVRHKKARRANEATAIAISPRSREGPGACA